MSLSQAVTSLFEQALVHDQALQRAARAAAGKEFKINPYITDFQKCPRSVWYSLRNIEPTNPPDGDSLANFLVGHAVEDAYARVMEQIGARVIREVRVELAGPLGEGVTSGRSDFLIFFDDVKAIVEMKTSKQKQAPFLPQKAHIHQLNGYLEAAHRGLLDGQGIHSDEVEGGVLVYVIKDAVKGRPVFKAYDVAYDPGMADSDLYLNEQLQLMAREPYPPDRPEGYTPKKFPCGYCDYRDHCWGQI